jgi:hypothetical protein
MKIKSNQSLDFMQSSSPWIFCIPDNPFLTCDELEISFAIIVKFSAVDICAGHIS